MATNLRAPTSAELRERAHKGVLEHTRHLEWATSNMHRYSAGASIDAVVMAGISDLADQLFTLASMSLGHGVSRAEYDAAMQAIQAARAIARPAAGESSGRHD